jgi:hypothetical protein
MSWETSKKVIPKNNKVAVDLSYNCMLNSIKIEKWPRRLLDKKFNRKSWNINLKKNKLTAKKIWKYKNDQIELHLKSNYSKNNKKLSKFVWWLTPSKNLRRQESNGTKRKESSKTKVFRKQKNFNKIWLNVP